MDARFARMAYDGVAAVRSFSPLDNATNTYRPSKLQVAGILHSFYPMSSRWLQSNGQMIAWTNDSARNPDDAVSCPPAFGHLLAAFRCPEKPKSTIDLIGHILKTVCGYGKQSPNCL
eukprot:scaffold266_cov248-Pinguiococcus_pyrenoidosus.AAC.17